jgi:biotin transport system substrate-specific component
MTTYSGQSIVDRVLPERHTRTAGLAFDLLAVVLAGVFIAFLAQVRIPLPFTPVPLTGQTLAVLVSAMALGSRRGGAAAVLYVLAGAAGLPVFSGSGSGFAHLAGPTGGYLVGFMTAAWVVGMLAEHGWDKRPLASLAAMLVGNAVIYTFGVLWLGSYVGFGRVLGLGVLPFIPGDIAKILVGSCLLPAAWKLFGKRA